MYNDFYLCNSSNHLIETNLNQIISTIYTSFISYHLSVELTTNKSNEIYKEKVKIKTNKQPYNKNNNTQ